MLNHFKRNCPLRIICDANKVGSGAVLDRQENEEWKPISFASRFLTELESKYSINELELPAIVWLVHYFRSYVYGESLKILSDLKALATILKGQKAKRTLIDSQGGFIGYYLMTLKLYTLPDAH